MPFLPSLSVLAVWLMLLNGVASTFREESKRTTFYIIAVPSYRLTDEGVISKGGEIQTDSNVEKDEVDPDDQDPPETQTEEMYTMTEVIKAVLMAIKGSGYTEEGETHVDSNPETDDFSEEEEDETKTEVEEKPIEEEELAENNDSLSEDMMEFPALPEPAKEGD